VGGLADNIPIHQSRGIESASGAVYVRQSLNFATPALTATHFRVTGDNNGAPNPFLGTVKVAVGATEGHVAPLTYPVHLTFGRQRRQSTPNNDGGQRQTERTFTSSWRRLLRPRNQRGMLLHEPPSSEPPRIHFTRAFAFRIAMENGPSDTLRVSVRNPLPFFAQPQEPSSSRNSVRSGSVLISRS
jgi:hypothetical protein